MKRSLHIVCAFALLELGMQAGCTTQPTGDGNTNGNNNTNGDTTGGNDNTNGDTTVQGGTLYHSRSDGAVVAA